MLLLLIILVFLLLGGGGYYGYRQQYYSGGGFGLLGLLGLWPVCLVYCPIAYPIRARSNPSPLWYNHGLLLGLLCLRLLAIVS